jgi:hypothetical protein
MTRTQLFILVMTALVLLVNLLARVLRRWVKGDVPRGMEPEAPQIPPRGRRPPPPWWSLDGQAGPHPRPRHALTGRPMPPADGRACPSGANGRCATASSS